MIYIIVILPWFYGLSEMDDSVSVAMPASVITSILIFVTAILALLPVFGWLTIPILMAIFFGFTMSLHFMPSGYLGSLIMLVLFFLASATSHLIPHEGLWDYK